MFLPTPRAPPQVSAAHLRSASGRPALPEIPFLWVCRAICWFPQRQNHREGPKAKVQELRPKSAENLKGHNAFQNFGALLHGWDSGSETRSTAGGPSGGPTPTGCPTTHGSTLKAPLLLPLLPLSSWILTHPDATFHSPEPPTEHFTHSGRYPAEVTCANRFHLKHRTVGPQRGFTTIKRLGDAAHLREWAKGALREHLHLRAADWLRPCAPRCAGWRCPSTGDREGQPVGRGARQRAAGRGRGLGANALGRRRVRQAARRSVAKSWVATTARLRARSVQSREQCTSRQFFSFFVVVNGLKSENTLGVRGGTLAGASRPARFARMSE